MKLIQGQNNSRPRNISLPHHCRLGINSVMLLFFGASTACFLLQEKLITLKNYFQIHYNQESIHTSLISCALQIAKNQQQK